MAATFATAGCLTSSSSQGDASTTISTSSKPLKPAKKYRSDDDSDKTVVRCKKKLDFVVDADTTTAMTSSSSRRRPAAAVARRNERERKRVSLINRTFETLRDQLPRTMWGHRHIGKVSKVETLRAAIGYIRTLQELLMENATDDDDVENEVATSGVVDGGSDVSDPLKRIDIAAGSAERLASLSSADPSSELCISQDNAVMFSLVGQHGGRILAADTSLRDDNDTGSSTAYRQMTSSRHQRLVFDATHRLAQLTAATMSMTSGCPTRATTSSMTSSPPRGISEIDVDINCNHRMNWTQFAVDKADASISVSGACDVIGPLEDIDEFDDLERYLMLGTNNNVDRHQIRHTVDTFSR